MHCSITYENGDIADQYIDENDYLNQEAADIVKNADYKDTNIETVLDGIDGIIFTGGEDISPTLYKDPQGWHGIEEEKDYNATRDVNDYLLMNYCIDNDIPVMGFCRGMQMLGVVSGATVIQDIPVYFEDQGIDMMEAIERTDKTFIAGFQFHPEASVVKHLNDVSNADDFISKEDAEKFFTVFVNAMASK